MNIEELVLNSCQYIFLRFLSKDCMNTRVVSFHLYKNMETVQTVRGQERSQVL